VGTSRSWNEVSRKFDRLAGGMSDMPNDTTKRVVTVAKAAYRASAPSRLRGVGKRGAALGVRDNTGRFPDGAKALIFATGPWQLIEADTKAHRIPRQRGARSRRSRFAVVPGGAEGGRHGRGGVRSSVQHPGTKGKAPWRKTTDKLQKSLPDMYAHAFVGEVRKVF
jgi:hypothetical protein